MIVVNFLSEGVDEEKTKMAEMLERIPDFCVLVFSETGVFDKRISLYKRIQKVRQINGIPAVNRK